MIEQDKLRILKHMTDEPDEAILIDYLTLAEHIVITLAYPFGDGTETMPARYAGTQLKIAAYMLNKRGAEGELSHSENGMTATYESGDIPLSLRREITPCAKVWG